MSPFSSARRLTRAFRQIALAPAAALILIATVALPAAAQTPSDVVAVLQDGLVNIMSNPPASGTGNRSAAFTALVENTFDINAMGAVAVGLDTYRSWSDAQRATFLAAFARFMVATHAARFESAPGQTFSIEGSKAARAGREIVHSRYSRAGRDPVAIDYLVRRSNEDWKILDVYLDGSISLLALNRSEFSSVLRDQGFEGFIAAMHAKADELSVPKATN
jgi:phospholipid transport system substrate-binding protein